MRKMEFMNNFEKAKGSITLFVLIGLMFLLIVVFLCFIGIKNKISEQERQIIKIQNEYNSTEINQIYDETVNIWKKQLILNK